MLRAVIIDDERYAREELRYLLQRFVDIDVIAEVARGDEAMVTVLEQAPDVVFLDIEMPKKNGIEIAQSFQQLKKRPHIIFTTAYPTFAVDAFRVNALDYLLKPYKREELAEAMIKLRSQTDQTSQSEHQEQYKRKLAVEVNDTILYIDVANIAYLYPAGKTSIIVTPKEQYTYKSTLKEAEERLRGFSFFRTHRSFLVNLAYVERMVPWFNGAYELKLAGIEEHVSVSRNYAKSFMERMHI